MSSPCRSISGAIRKPIAKLTNKPMITVRQPANCAGAKSEHARLTPQQVLEHGPGERCHRRREGGRSKGVRCNCVGAEGAAGIKAIPAHPEQSSADHAEDHAVWRQNFATKS